MANAALICACVPASVSAPLPLAPAPMVAPPARLTVSVPLPTDSATVPTLPSRSLTLMPPIASAVSSFTVCAPGTVLTGASLALVTVTLMTWVSKPPAPSLTCTVTS